MTRSIRSLFGGLAASAAALGLVTPAVASDALPSEVAAPAPAANSSPVLQWGDFDGDAYPDALSVGADGTVSLHQNLGNGSFAEITDIAGLQSLPKATLALFEDFDGDGLADVFVGHQGGGASLMRNRGLGFESAGGRGGLPVHGQVKGAHWIDYDADGRPDLHVVTDVESVMLHALWGGAFEPIVLSTVAGAAGDHGHGAGGLAGGPANDDGGEDAADQDPADGRAGGQGAGQRGVPTMAGVPGAPSAAIPLVPGGTLDVRPGGITGGSGGTTTQGSTAPVGCMGSIGDASGPGCIQASTVPTLGMLHPLSEDFWITAGGRVGIGTTDPNRPLHVKNEAGTSGVKVEGNKALLELFRASDDRAAVRFYTNGQEDWFIGTDDDPSSYTDDLAFKRGANESPDMVIDAVSGDVTVLEDLKIKGDMLVDGGGSMGIGTSTPASRLHVNGSTETTLTTHGLLLVGDSGGANISMDKNDIQARDGTSAAVLRLNNSGGNVNVSGGGDLIVAGGSDMVVSGTGNLGINTNSPTESIHVVEQAGQVGLLLEELVAGAGSTLRLKNTNRFWSLISDADPDVFMINEEGGSGPALAIIPGGNVGIGTDSPATTLDVDGALTIRGGADIVESFESSCGVLEPGTVVAIDPDHPGRLMCSVDAYDTKVAGVVSGAGGVNPGIMLGQDELFTGDTKVAMTGRVYVKCTTEGGPVRPGDRLTTSSLAGHAMRVSDDGRSIGAVIGKAMSSLDDGTGLVLVLVNLQ
jgi:hypothetical protein